jgi:hypothetical protein
MCPPKLSKKALHIRAGPRGSLFVLGIANYRCVSFRKQAFLSFFATHRKQFQLGKRIRQEKDDFLPLRPTFPDMSVALSFWDTPE